MEDEEGSKFSLVTKRTLSRQNLRFYSNINSILTNKTVKCITHWGFFIGRMHPKTCLQQWYERRKYLLMSAETEGNSHTTPYPPSSRGVSRLRFKFSFFLALSQWDVTSSHGWQTTLGFRQLEIVFDNRSPTRAICKHTYNNSRPLFAQEAKWFSSF